MKYRSYIILGKEKSTNKIVGYIENSFSMGISEDRVRVDRVYEYGKDKETRKRKASIFLQKEVNKLNKKESTYVFKLFRVCSKFCPVKIDFRETIAMRQKTSKYDKFKQRNLPFSLNGIQF